MDRYFSSVLRNDTMIVDENSEIKVRCNINVYEFMSKENNLIKLIHSNKEIIRCFEFSNNLRSKINILIYLNFN